MRFCPNHWDALRAAIEQRGLSGFVADSGEKAMANIERSLEENTVTIDSFDPLMGAHWGLVARLSEAAGYPLLFIDGCPVCLGNEEHVKGCQDKDCEFTFDTWIELAADEQLSILREIQANG